MAILDALDRKAKTAVSAALEPDEQVRLVIPGEGGSALVATNRRVLVYKRGIMTGSAFGRQLNSWEYSMVSGIEAKQAMTTKTVVLEIPGALPVTKIGRFDKGPQSAWEAPNALVLRWAALRDQGLLTEEEFQHQKRKLLGL